MTIIPKPWQRRIKRSVNWTEQQAVGPARAGAFEGAVPSGHPMLLVAMEDIEHDTIGKCRIAKGEWDPVSIVESGAAADDVEVFNGREKIWSGSRVLAIWPSFQWDSPGSESITGIWYALAAWSATRIRGTSDAIISPGATGSISSVKPLNGHFGSGNASVFLPTTHVTIEANLAVWAELVWDPVGESSRWEVYSADCVEAGG